MIVPQLVEELAKELREAVEEVVELTESLESLQADLEQKRIAVKRLKVALEALTGSEVPVKVDLYDTPDPEYVENKALTSTVIHAVPIPKPRVQNPCNSCGGEMYYQAKTLNNGKVVNLWVCGECSNERF